MTKEVELVKKDVLQDDTQTPQKWTKDQENYLDWLSVPKGERAPKTKTEFADKVDVCRKTLWHWEQKPGFNQERLRRTVSNFIPNTPDVISALLKRAKRGDTRAIDIWLTKIEEIADKLEIEGEFQTLTYAQVLKLIYEVENSDRKPDKSEE